MGSKLDFEAESLLPQALNDDEQSSCYAAQVTYRSSIG